MIMTATHFFQRGVLLGSSVLSRWTRKLSSNLGEGVSFCSFCFGAGKTVTAVAQTEKKILGKRSDSDVPYDYGEWY